MKKPAFLITAALMLCLTIHCSAYEKIDYTSKLDELNTLIKQCEAKGIATDYEMVNYAVIERFNDYINIDIDNGVEDSIIEYNVSCMDELYSEAKNNLEAYLTGKKTPFEVIRTDMDSITNDGAVLKNGDKSVFSIGYGHSQDVRNDIEIFNNLGTNNIQVEIGPRKFGRGVYGFNTNYYADGDVCIASEAAKDSSYGLKIEGYTPKTENKVIWVQQMLECKPLTTYNFSCDVKYASGTGKGYGVWIGIGNDRHFVNEKDTDWQTLSFQYTTAQNQTSMVVNIVSQDQNIVYVDNISIREASSGNEMDIVNADFENSDTSYAYSIGYVFDVLNRAYENNIGVSLNLSPHYFPENLSEEVYASDSKFFIQYNIDEPQAWTVIENYLEELMPLLKGYPALQNICLSNEPDYDTREFPDFYNPRFREYLEKKHSSINMLNEAYGLEGDAIYERFDEITMPQNSELATPLGYDWVEFNDSVFTEWHKKMADIVHKYLPDIPVHTKMQNYIYVKDSITNLARGKDLELFDSFSDYAGNDAIDYLEDINRYYQTMFLYDYQSSVTNKPVYNSEDHIISDKNPDFSQNQRKHWRNNLWMGAVHGRSMSTIWAWQRGEETTSATYFSTAYRPDCTAETGKTSLDLARLANEVAELSKSDTKAAIFYSKPSRLYHNNAYCENLLETYKALLEIGIRPGIVSDKSISELSEYEILIIPEAENCFPKTLAEVNEFIHNGGCVLYQGDVFSKNQYNVSQDNSYIKANAEVYTSTIKNNILETEKISKALKQHLKEYVRVTLLDNNSKELPLDIDFRYSIKNGRLLISLTNLEYDNTKNISVYLDGKKLTEMKNLIMGAEISDTVLLEEYTPQLLSYMIELPEIYDVYIDKNKADISWDYSKNSYWGADIYNVNKDTSLTIAETVEGASYIYPQYGTWLIRAVNGDDKDYGKMVTISESCPVKVTVYKAEKKENGIYTQIRVDNIFPLPVYTELEIKVFDADGKVIGKSVNKMVLKTGQGNELNLLLSTEDPVEKAVAYVWDTDKNNCYRETVILK